MKSSSVWAYPTLWPETNCITALKTQASGMEPITSGYAALQETVKQKSEIFVNNISTSPEEKRLFTNRLINALMNPLTEDERTEMSEEIIRSFNWNKIAKKWSYAIKNKIDNKKI